MANQAMPSLSPFLGFFNGILISQKNALVHMTLHKGDSEWPTKK